MSAKDPRAELERIHRVSDQSLSAHCSLAERNGSLAWGVDFLTMGLSLWLIAVAFVPEPVARKLAPFGWNPQIWTGCLAILVFLLTLLQILAGWKGKAEAHRRTADLYSEIKGGAGAELANPVINSQAYDRICSRYSMVGQLGTPIPNSVFLREKRRHKMKVALSTHLDTHPAASITWLKIRFWWRDNVAVLWSRS